KVNDLPLLAAKLPPGAAGGGGIYIIPELSRQGVSGTPLSVEEHVLLQDDADLASKPGWVDHRHIDAIDQHHRPLASTHHRPAPQGLGKTSLDDRKSQFLSTPRRQTGILVDVHLVPLR
ncbi:hypothetical protein NKH00_28220, partial [Mesorhizobium sp. M1405]